MTWLSYRRFSACNDDDMMVTMMSRLVCNCCCLAVFYLMLVRRRGVVDVSVWGRTSPCQKCQYLGTILTICFHRPALASTNYTENCRKMSYEGTIWKALGRQAHTRVLWHLMILDTNLCPRAQSEGHIHHQTDVSVWGWAAPCRKCQHPGTILTICFHRPALASTSCTENCQKSSYQGTI